jgi:NhaA family Na+:H+ antiporter
LALAVANSPLSNLYNALLETPVAVQVGALSIDKPLLLWVNDGLMAVFFFLIGLEIKREFVEGELSTADQIVLPGVGALGGMVVPAAIYAWINLGDPVALDGWAMLLAGVSALIIAITMNKSGVTRTSSYVLLGVILWIAVLKSGVHATLAGVLIAFCVPMWDARGGSPLRELEQNLHGPVAFVILPVFAFANTGLSLVGMSIEDLSHPVTAGIIFGLLLGKPLGILSFTWLAFVLGIARLPENTNWRQLTGVAFACGIGFTMSLFIAGLAFEHGSGDYFGGDRLGILVGSILSALAAYCVLHISLPKTARV